MSFALPVQTERMRLRSGPELHVERSGTGERALVALHGGPGLSCEYLAPLHTLAHADRTIIMYDQAGGGRSSDPRDLTHATINNLADDLVALLDELDLDEVDLFGHSFGAMLALQFTLDHPDHVRSLVLASGSASASQASGSLVEALLRYRGPEAVARALSAEVRGDADDPVYWEIVASLFEPGSFTAADGEEALLRWRAEFDTAGPMCDALWGPWQFTVTGSLREWDVRPRLGEITVPTLVTNGRNDYASTDLVIEIADQIPRGEYACVGTGHDGFLQQPALDLFLALLEGHLEHS